MSDQLVVAAAVVALVLLVALGVFQVALVAGAPIGHLAWGGQYRVLPTRMRVGSVVSIVLYVLFAAVIADRAGLADLLPGAASRIGSWVLTVYFALGVVLNGISRSRPERITMAPTSAVLAACCMLLAVGAG